MYSCREVTQLVSEGWDRPLPRRQRVAVRLHVVFCRGCARFCAQMRLLKTALGRLHEALPQEGERLSEAARERIRRTLVE